MKNGDRITGEIRKLEHGALYIRVDYVAGETLAVDWLQVERLESIARYRITLEDGTQLTGTVEKVPAQEAPNEDFRIEEAGANAQVAAGEVVGIQSQKRNFWRQLKGSVDFGQSFTSGNSQISIHFEAIAKYASTKYLAQAGLSTSRSGQSGGTKTNRYDASAFGGRFLTRNDLVFGLADFLHSSQQSLDLRTTLAGGYGRYVVHSNRTELGLLGGLAFTKENFDPSAGLAPETKNLEGLIGFRYSTFRFNKVEFQAGLMTYPGITDAGRFRASANSSLTLKLVRDFHLRFNFWDNLDTKPPVNAKKNELGVSTTFGLSF